MRTKLLVMAAALAWCGISGAAAQAQTIYGADFTTTFPNFGYGYGYSGYGTPVTSVDPPPYFAINTNAQTPSTYTVPTSFNAATPAATATIDTTNWVIPPDNSYVYAGVGLGMGFQFPATGKPTSGDLSQYKVTFDIKVEGYNPLDDGLRTKMLITFQGPGFGAESYSLGVNDDRVNGVPINLGNFTEVPLFTSTVQTFSHPLSDFALIGTPTWDFPTLFASATQIQVQVEPYLTSATNPDEIGLDNNNIVTLDNVKIEGPFATGAPGDYDDDDDVDGADVLDWQRGGSPGGVTPADLQTWKNNYGTQPVATAIPEPGCLAMAGVAALTLLAPSRRRSPRRPQRDFGGINRHLPPPMNSRRSPGDQHIRRTAGTLVGWSLAAAALLLAHTGRTDLAQTSIQSPDGRNAIVLQATGDGRDALNYAVSRDGRTLIGPSPLGPVLAEGGALGEGARIVAVEQGRVDETFELLWGKTRTVLNRCSTALVTLATPGDLRWQVELRPYDDGVAFRYRLLPQGQQRDFVVRADATEFAVQGEPTALFTGYDSFTTSHEGLYERKPLGEIPAKLLLEMPLLVTWPNGPAAAITEARVRQFAGMLLERDADRPALLRGRLSPLPLHPDVSVVGRAPHDSPWRVVMLADRAGELLSSNLLVCLNDPPPPELGDFAWLRPGKTTLHWWYGAFEDDFQPSAKRGAGLARHKQYIDFCAAHGIAYHAVSGDGLAWYPQSSTNYGVPGPDADVRTARPEIELPAIIAYARERGVRIRLWVHWKPLNEQLEEAFTKYEEWGVAGLMVDFLDRDDQQMNDFTERMLESAARHHLHIQIHGSPKPSGEQRTFPNLFNREGVRNLEYLKWSDGVTPAHNVNVAYTRNLAGLCDYHLGGFRSVSRAEFQPRDRAPVVMGTRCHHLALYVVYENPMPMVADDPSAYEGQPGFDFLVDVPTTWDETRFVAGEPGEYVVLAHGAGDSWYLGGITNWTPREIDVPLDFLPPGEFAAKLYVDGSLDESQPNALREDHFAVRTTTPLRISLAPGGGFVAVLRTP